MMNEPWSGFSFIARPHSRLMIIWIASARRTDSSDGRGDGLVVGVGVQAVGVVVDRDQRLQRGADVVEVHLLRVQRPAARLDVVLQLLRALVGAVLLLHRDRPDAAGDAADDGVLRVHAVGEEERQVRREVVDVHAAREVGLDVGEPVGEGERELADGVRPGLGDVVAGDRHRVEVADLLLDEPLLDVGHHPQRELGGEQAGVLALVLLEDVGLHGAADASREPRLASGSIGRRSRGCWSITVLRKNASTVGAGPLIVIDTEVVGASRSKPS